ncbi:MAG: nitrilase-related carbon-nitrogen hydrolase [Rectinemataceae bacterium]
MRIAVVQSAPIFGDIEANLEALRAAIRGHDADLYVLPELCLTGYDFLDAAETSRLAQRPEGSVVSALSDAALSRGAGVVFGFAEAAAGGSCFNSALLSLPDGRRRVYRKTHLYAREKLLFSPGDTGFFVEDFRDLRIGLAICFDWIFPESFRSLALRGADLVAHPANLVLPFCQRADFARAVENRIYVATANRVGAEDRTGRKLEFTGESVVVAPDGEYLARLSPDRSEVAVVDLKSERSRDKRLNPWNSLFEDRRPEMYER